MMLDPFVGRGYLAENPTVFQAKLTSKLAPCISFLFSKHSPWKLLEKPLGIRHGTLQRRHQAK
jgi:hypothetical protein